jgi:hypothetical protein
MHGVHKTLPRLNMKVLFVLCVFLCLTLQGIVSFFNFVKISIEKEKSH